MSPFQPGFRARFSRRALLASAAGGLAWPWSTGARANAPATATGATRRGAPVFVLNSLDGDVSVIDSTAWKEIKRIPTGKEPHHLYLTPDERSVIVANAASDSLTFIDPRTGA